MVNISFGNIDSDSAKTQSMTIFEYEWERWDTSNNCPFSHADWHNICLASIENDGTFTPYSSNHVNLNFCEMFDKYSNNETIFSLTRCYKVDYGGGAETDYSINNTYSTYTLNNTTLYHLTYPGVSSFQNGVGRGLLSIEHSPSKTFDPSYYILGNPIESPDTWYSALNTIMYNNILAYQNYLNASGTAFTEIMDAINAMSSDRFVLNQMPTLNINKPFVLLKEDDEVEFQCTYDISDSETLYCIIRFILKNSEP